MGTGALPLICSIVIWLRCRHEHPIGQYWLCAQPRDQSNHQTFTPAGCLHCPRVAATGRRCGVGGVFVFLSIVAAPTRANFLGRCDRRKRVSYNCPTATSRINFCGSITAWMHGAVGYTVCSRRIGSMTRRHAPGFGRRSGRNAQCGPMSTLPLPPGCRM